MKFNVVFSISEGRVIFFQVANGPKKQVTAIEAIDTGNQNDAQISQALSAFIAQKKINLSECRVTIVIPRSRAIFRFMSFPSQKEDEIRSMIDLQVGSRIPFAREEVEIDFQILSKTADGYTKVAVVVIPEDIAMRYWRVFSDAKVPIDSMTISSVGLWLLYQQQPDLSDKPGAIIDLDLNHSEICLCYKTHWLTSREIPIGFVQMQQDGYVEILKQWELTQNNMSGEKLTEAVQSVYLVSTANRSYSLSLEMSKVQEDLNIKELLLPQSLPLARGVQWPNVMTEDGVSVAALAGIAFSAQRPPIDLIPHAVRSTQAQRTYKRQLIILTIWISAALISLALVLATGFFSKNVQLARLEDQLHRTKHDALQVEAELKKIHSIETFVQGRLIFADLARRIYSLLPPHVYLVNITISDGNVMSFQGISTTPVEINQFQKGLVESKKFSNVSLDNVNKRVTQQGEVEYFKITCALKSADIRK